MPKVVPAGCETATDDRLGNIVPALAHTLGDSGDGAFGVRETQEKQTEVAPFLAFYPVRSIEAVGENEVVTDLISPNIHRDATGSGHTALILIKIEVQIIFRA